MVELSFFSNGWALALKLLLNSLVKHSIPSLENDCFLGKSRVGYTTLKCEHAQVVKWYTRTLEVRMPKGVEVQVLSWAPNT